MDSSILLPHLLRLVLYHTPDRNMYSCGLTAPKRKKGLPGEKPRDDSRKVVEYLTKLSSSPNTVSTVCLLRSLCTGNTIS